MILHMEALGPCEKSIMRTIIQNLTVLSFFGAIATGLPISAKAQQTFVSEPRVGAEITQPPNSRRPTRYRHNYNHQPYVYPQYPYVYQYYRGRGGSDNALQPLNPSHFSYFGD